MTPTDVKLVLHEVLANGVSLNATAYVVLILGWIVAGALGAFLGAFFGKRGETVSVKRDLETIKDNLRQTTAATEEIKADIAAGLWVEQSRWTFKAGFYKELLETLGVMASALTQVAAAEKLQASAKDAGERARYEALEKEFDQQAVSAFARLIKCEAVARAWLGTEALDALDAFAADWATGFETKTPIPERTRHFQTAAGKLHALLCKHAQDDLQLRRST
jgi:hypothetical protein